VVSRTPSHGTGRRLAIAGLLCVLGAGDGSAQQEPTADVGPPEIEAPKPPSREEVLLGPPGNPMRERRSECVRLYETKRYDKAAECWREVLDAGATDVFAIRTLAFSYFYSNDPDPALHYFDQVLLRNPNDILSLKGKGLVGITLFRNELAEESFGRAVELAPKSETYWRLYGLSLHRQDRFDEALAAYDHALSLRPKSVSAWALRGGLLFRVGRYDDAMRSFDKILEIDPTSELAWRNKGSCLIESERPKDALKMFDVAIDINPLSVPAWYNRGVALERLGELDEARRHYERALQIDPSYAEAQRALDLLNQAPETGG
jgi:tetratricopeptide (TPR) repeat protein